MTKIAITLLLVLFAPSLFADVLVASWNIKRLGHKPEKDMAVVLDVLDDYEIVALQEVMRPNRVRRIEKQLEDRSDVEWEHLCSHAIGRNSYKEAYCFLWRTDRVSYEAGAVVYLDPGDVFEREPFSAVFRSDDDELFLLATVHVVYGDSKRDRRLEGRALRDYWDWLAETFPEPALVLAGDFNLWPDDRSLAPLAEVATPLIVRGGTTLSSKEGRYANLYDHIWVSGKITSIEAGIRKIPVEFGLSHKTVRRYVSDHVPVWAALRASDE